MKFEIYYNRKERSMIYVHTEALFPLFSAFSCGPPTEQ